jgi:hypothetical protein
VSYTCLFRAGKDSTEFSPWATYYLNKGNKWGNFLPAMKKSDDLSQAFLLKQFPGRRKLSRSVPSEVSWRNLVLVVTTALLLAIVTSVILIRQTRESLQQEQVHRQILEQKITAAENHMAYLQKIHSSYASQKADFNKEILGLAETSGKEEKLFFNKMIGIMEKYQLTQLEAAQGLLPAEAHIAPEVARGTLPPWEKVE